MVIGFVIWSVCSMIFIVIGIDCWKSQNAVGFFTFTKPPMIKEENVKKYNHAVSILWFIFAVLLEAVGLPLLFINQNSPVFVLMIFEVIVLVIALIIAFIQIERKYTG